MSKDNSWIFRRLVEVNCTTGGPHGKRCSSVSSYYCCWMCKFLDECARKWKRTFPIEASIDYNKLCKRRNKHSCSAALKAWLEERRE